jgi:H+-transporting ATPase
MGDKIYDSERLLGGGMAGSEVRDFLEAADGLCVLFLSFFASLPS